MDDVMSTETAPKAKDRSRFAIFYERDAPSLDETGMMEYKSTEEAVAGSQKLLDAGVMNGSVITQLFRHSGENGFSLVYVCGSSRTTTCHGTATTSTACTTSSVVRSLWAARCWGWVTGSTSHVTRCTAIGPDPKELRSSSSAMPRPSISSWTRSPKPSTGLSRPSRKIVISGLVIRYHRAAASEDPYFSFAAFFMIFSSFPTRSVMS